jgi:hypothetical protein
VDYSSTDTSKEREEPFCWFWLVLAIQPLRAQKIYNPRVALVQSAGIFIRNRAEHGTIAALAGSNTNRFNQKAFLRCGI